MSRRAHVTQDEVNQAANELLAAGTTPTTTLIQQRVGGSFTTIGRLFEVWEQQHRAEPAGAIEIPDDVARAATESLQMLWRTAFDLARREVAQVRAAAAEELAAVQSKRDEQAGAIERLELEAEGYEHQVRQLQQQIESLQGTLAQAQTSAEIATARVQDRERQLAERDRTLAERDEQITDLRSEVAQARREVEQASKAAQEAQAGRAQLQGRLDEAAAQAAQQTQRYTDLQLAHARQTGELEAQHQRLDEQARIIDRLTAASTPPPDEGERSRAQASRVKSARKEQDQ